MGKRTFKNYFLAILLEFLGLATVAFGLVLIVCFFVVFKLQDKRVALLIIAAGFSFLAGFDFDIYEKWIEKKTGVRISRSSRIQK